MRNSLIFKLLGAFLLVTAISALVISILTSLATRNAFTLYTTRSGQAFAQQLAPELADYYSQTNSWQGVDTILLSEFGSHSGLGSMIGRGPGTGNQANGSGGTTTPGFGIGMSAGGQRLLLVDEKGIVVSDTQGELTGTQITSTALKNGTPITVDNKLVGTIIVTPINITASGTPAGDFLASVNRAIISSAVIAGAIALLLGALLFIQITAPLHRLKKAATAIAHGDLSQRVKIRSHDEFGELGLTFNMMAESLSKAEIQRQHLVADVAHELRTPLAAIQGTLEGMQDGVLPLDGEQLAALHSETTLLNRLVGDLRLLSIAETGQLKLERQKVEPGRMIQEVVERAKPQASQRNIHLVTDIQSDLPEIWMDADRITQVLNNLISNALRYTPEDGTITVQAVCPSGRTSLYVSVLDTGTGIDTENLPHVFDRFFRADVSRSRSSGGSGLGLAIVKQLVEAHGGKVKVESPATQDKDGRKVGAKISFTIPY